MKVLVDTSVWIDFFNGFDSPEALALTGLLEADADIVTCGVVIAEFFQGLTSNQSRRQLEPYFRDMRYLEARAPDTWLAAADLYRGLRERGITIRSMPDCVIAQLAAESDGVVLSRDRDLRAILASDLCGARAFPIS